MTKIKFYGYLDNDVISSGFLIPIYSNANKFYFNELSKDNKTITGFREFDQNMYTRDSIVKLKHPHPAEIDGESYMVIKYNDNVKTGTFSEILDWISRKILLGEIESNILIDNAKKLLGDAFKGEVLEESIKILSSLRGIKKTVLTRRLSEYSSLGLIKVVSGNDNKFKNYFETLITDKNKRILRVPASVDIVVNDEHHVTFSSSLVSYDPNLDALGLKAIQIPVKNSIHQNVWRIKKEGEKKFTNFCLYSTEKKGIEMAKLSSKINETFAEVK
ncbi:MAG: hypothetical protein DI588_00225 [Flavobacterium johnsoniae]|nr:MAG: hypothetical protein DI588_00225 [Flavobacterium johnsoniae]